ncbi:hypothetical protein COU36_04605 [Candidatus Micrarchaeota archaeon CG10_big_fil_rev_8_21_14_0_10_59_7]|nr:MAG: hypothetical protein COU36_04605 [Candidatus Micrarchaeota archaeon CG10_big_fil_rev_8_21_14_0_10_59_7]
MEKGLAIGITAAVFLVLLGLTFVAYGTGVKATDYSKPEHWLSVPAVNDAAVDVFYIYPTAWQKANESSPNICEIDNPSMLNGSKVEFAGQATAFEPVGNIFAPYYRQADAGYVLSLPLSEQETMMGGIPKTDVFAAFDYYIKNYNNGRPFILAGHSQGSNVMIYLLSEYMKENPKVYERMVAAYVIGYSITDEYLAENPHLKFAEGPDDTGVIISYNTESPDVVAGSNPVVLPGAIAINPITWTRGEEPATTEESLGAFMPNAEGIYVRMNNFADARVDKAKGAVICSTANVSELSPGNPVFGRGVFHIYDYQFYYYDIRENAANRARRFLQK